MIATEMLQSKPRERWTNQAVSSVAGWLSMDADGGGSEALRGDVKLY